MTTGNFQNMKDMIQCCAAALYSAEATLQQHQDMVAAFHDLLSHSDNDIAAERAECDRRIEQIEWRRDFAVKMISLLSGDPRMNAAEGDSQSAPADNPAPAEAEAA